VEHAVLEAIILHYCSEVEHCVHVAYSTLPPFTAEIDTIAKTNCPIARRIFGHYVPLLWATLWAVSKLFIERYYPTWLYTLRLAGDHVC